MATVQLRFDGRKSEARFVAIISPHRSHDDEWYDFIFLKALPQSFH